uniref:Myb-like domain-containing protein n=1 Tax=Kalanchoe fedtschenkoi TaxID=63787 RepID=A0A7N0RD66_KALFE
MEFLDEESRPRFLFQSRAHPSSSSESATSESRKINKLLIWVTTSIAILLVVLTFLFAANHEPLTSILLWVAVSILIGPFAPGSVTGGDVRVGNGSVVEEPEPDPVETEVRKPKQHRGGSWRQNEEQSRRSDAVVKVEKEDSASEAEKIDSFAEEGSGSAAAVEEREWTEEDFELLKKQMVKNPVGKTRRWEVIAEAFQGRHKVESVVKMAKSMAERRMGNGDSYTQFLKNRKPLDSRAVESDNGGMVAEESKKEDGSNTGWSPGEDKALLNALKAFPKDTTMRWEKISAAVPGRSKKACMKRVADLARDFRSSKAS